MALHVLHHGIELPDLRLTVPTTSDWRHQRFLVRVQIDTDDLQLALSSTGEVELRDFLAVRHIEKTTKLKRGILEGQRHSGGVTFDVLPRDG